MAVELQREPTNLRYTGGSQQISARVVQFDTNPGGYNDLDFMKGSSCSMKTKAFDYP